MINKITGFKFENKEGGFLSLIILIIIALLIMKYMGVSISGVVDWFKTFFSTVLK